MHVVSNFIKSFNAPETENKIETIVTKTYIKESQPSNSDMAVTTIYGSGSKSIHEAINGETNRVKFAKYLEDGNHHVDKKITKMENDGIDSNENSSSEGNDFIVDKDIEAYDDGDDDDDDDENMNDDDDENMIDDNVEIKEEDFNKVMQESMVFQVS